MCVCVVGGGDDTICHVVELNITVFVLILFISTDVRTLEGD